MSRGDFRLSELFTRGGMRSPSIRHAGNDPVLHDLTGKKPKLSAQRLEKGWAWDIKLSVKGNDLGVWGVMTLLMHYSGVLDPAVVHLPFPFNICKYWPTILNLSSGFNSSQQQRFWKFTQLFLHLKKADFVHSVTFSLKRHDGSHCPPRRETGSSDPAAFVMGARWAGPWPTAPYIQL